MEVLLKSRANSMPHKMYTLQTGEKIVQKVLPIDTKQKDLLAEVNTISCGIPHVSNMPTMEHGVVWIYLHLHRVIIILLLVVLQSY